MNSENLSTGKENFKRVKEQNVVSYAGVRNPLGQLSENVAGNNKRTVQKSVSTIKTSKTTVKTRSVSTSQEETDIQYFFESRNITKRQTISQSASTLFDEVFVEGEKHYINYLPENRAAGCVHKKPKSEEAESKIAQALPVVRTSTGQQRKPVQKITLVRKLSSRFRRIVIEEIYQNCLYDKDYFEENHFYMLQQERPFVWRKDYLERYSDSNFRRLVVNWLIYAQQALHLTEQTYFVAIRMFDYILISTKLQRNKYVLVGTVCLWIANKMFDVQFIEVPKLFSLTSGKYSRLQIISTEQDILKALKFNINFPEPTTFLYYYMKRENLATDSKILYSSMFLLEMFTLLTDFSSLAPSLLAAIALHLVLIKYDLDGGYFLEYIHDHLLNKDIFKRKSEQLAICLKELLNCKCVSNEAVAKYSTSDRHHVALNFTYE